ncbi:MAG: lyase [Alphaproteobacteria bacterium]|nr:lyase [Alphaproteobacteria bacterium]
MRALALSIVLASIPLASTALAQKVTRQVYAVPEGSHPHDVAPAADGGIWYTAQHRGALGHLDPKTGKVEEVKLGQGSRPHGVILAADGAAWVTDSGLNAMVRVDGKTRAVTSFPLPQGSGYTNLNTAAIDGRGVIWFTGQSGIYGRLDAAKNDLKLWTSPKGRGPYGIAATPKGEIWYVSLAGSYLAQIDTASGEAKLFPPPTPDQGARRVWSDSKGLLWVSEWNSGNVSRYDPVKGDWKLWRLPGQRPRTYSVYVDETDKVWLTEWTANAVVRFDPATEVFESFPSERANSTVRQMLGRKGEVFAPESGTDRLVVFRY